MNFGFGIIILIVMLSACTYVGWHVWQILPLPVMCKWIAVALMALSVVLLFTNFIFGLDNKPATLATILYTVGSSSIFIGLYMAMLFIVLDLGRLVHLIPKSLLYNSWAGSISVFVTIFGIFLYGNLHYYNKARVDLKLETPAILKKPVRIVMMSDLHLGYPNQVDEFRKWVDKVNAERPDLILIAGDILDGNIGIVRRQNMQQEFRRLNAPIYACLGNHEYLTGRNESIRFYSEAGINLLIDSVATVSLPSKDTIAIIGRDDRTNPNRKSVAQLLENAPFGAFSILLDHQPYHLEEAEQAGINFQFSGHTHYGQVWPISWIEDLIYEDAFGSLRKGKTDYYVSSGIGIWGGKFRIGTRSEYVVAEINSTAK